MSLSSSSWSDMALAFSCQLLRLQSVAKLLGHFATLKLKHMPFAKFPTASLINTLRGTMVISFRVCLILCRGERAELFYLELGYLKIKKKQSGVPTVLQPILGSKCEQTSRHRRDTSGRRWSAFITSRCNLIKLEPDLHPRVCKRSRLQRRHQTSPGQIILQYRIHLIFVAKVLGLSRQHGSVSAIYQNFTRIYWVSLWWLLTYRRTAVKRRLKRVFLCPVIAV